MRNVIVNIVIWTLLLVAALQTGVAADEALKKKIDSLFIIASSGEVMYRDQNEPAMDSMAAIGVDAVPYLIDKFTTRSARQRWTVIWTLERIGAPAVPDLVAALSGPDNLVVERVCWALGSIRDSSAVEPLIAVSNHERWQVRDQAVGALGKIKDSRAEEVVVAAFQDSIGQVRKSAAVSYGQIGLNGHESVLVHMLGDDFYGARMSAMHTLLSMDTATVIRAVTDSIHSANFFVGHLGCQILGRLGSGEALDELFGLTDPMERPDLRAHAAVALIAADSTDHCGYRQGVLDKETDRLVRLKIESAIYTAEHGQ